MTHRVVEASHPLRIHPLGPTDSPPRPAEPQFVPLPPLQILADLADTGIMADTGAHPLRTFRPHVYGATQNSTLNTHLGRGSIATLHGSTRPR